MDATPATTRGGHGGDGLGGDALPDPPPELPAAAPQTAQTQTPSPPAALARRATRLSRGAPPPTGAKDPDPARQQPTASAPSVPSSSASANASSLDPLSQVGPLPLPSSRSPSPLLTPEHILRRTNTDLARGPKLRAQPPPDSPVADAPSPVADSPLRFAASADAGREKRKSFLGRLSMRGTRKKEDASDYASELGEPRTEGSNAHVFSSVVDAAGFIPHHKEPPRYIRVKAHNKKTKEFDRMFLAQELVGTRPRPSADTDARVPVVTVSTAGQGRKKTATGGAIWTTEFSKDGRYLAAGGRDHVVRVWAVIATPEDRRAQEALEAQCGGGAGERLSAPVFLEKPVQEFAGHTGEVLDISWSKNNFLLSTSMDKTVRLWHISRQECLCTFKHKELVSKVAFHPRDDRFFLAGCLDATLRLWSIPDKSVAFAAPMSDMITAVAFSPDGALAIAGLLNGFCYLLETEGLKPLTQIHVRSSRGRNAKGSKITGIVPMVLPARSSNHAGNGSSNHSNHSDTVLLITSTDARVRVYHLRDKSLDCKFKGHEHASGQLSASFSDDGQYIVCGSESSKVFLWSVAPSAAAAAASVAKDRHPCETFDAASDMVSTAIFAPTQTRQLLGASGDPIYDLCNPPPITLMSLEETLLASRSGQQEETAAPPPSPPPLPPAYVARSTHYDGNIIVTSDDTGIIKVFRQDCAASKRRHESWETGSSLGRKLGATSELVGRSGSIITRTSASSAAHSRRGSLSLPLHHVAGSTGGGGGAASQLAGNPDRINSWRQGIERGGSGGGSSRPTSLAGIGGSPAARSDRSISPNKATPTPTPPPPPPPPPVLTDAGGGGGLASDARRQPYAATMSSPLSPHFAERQSRAHVTASTTSALARERPAAAPAAAVPAAAAPPPAAAGNNGPSTTEPAAQKDGKDAGRAESDGPEPQPLRLSGPTLTFKSGTDEEALRLDAAGAGSGFWNLNKWKGIAGLRASLIGGGGGGERSGTPEPAKEGAARPSAGASASAAGKEEGVAVKGAAKERTKRRDAAAALTPTIAIADSGDAHLQPPSRSRSHSPYARSGSILSRLSSEMTSSGGEEAEAEDAEGGGDRGDGEEMRCTKCGGREFKARRLGGVPTLQCSRCGKLVDETGSAF